MKKLTKAAVTTKTDKTNSANKTNGKSPNPTKAGEAGFLHVAMAKRSREGLNKLVDAMEAPGQRQVLEQLIADELHRRGMRLPRAA